MSRDGYLPDDVRESDLPGADDQHEAACPCHEDAPEKCVCGCDFEGHPEDRCERVDGTCACDGRELAETECVCADIAEQREADRSDAAYERMRERQ